ncbi:hypothetical protein HRG_000439 [Hirsutella rhossiliensis]|uniref:Uncharacterized protein n=1 Tax=Hirsutella rhossiliensis TaxID=111463 RepID=A0A9P8NAW6_9HYPO|nr:uncharacterized protein HRG_00439 [Hirsutella rhossiliensis]KAH0967797.1 hypothetical protein HRG_00439 [Hirsutella rhossiliensis]
MPTATATMMMAPTSSDATYYYFVPDLRALDPAAREVDLDAHVWVQPTVIDDDDLTFGGKSLSTWYEEERRRLSSGGSDDGHSQSSHNEERRGRERTRRHHKGALSKGHGHK